jgi:hypothetical protein
MHQPAAAGGQGPKPDAEEITLALLCLMRAMWYQLGISNAV